jgi:hypothetical protein
LGPCPPPDHHQPAFAAGRAAGEARELDFMPWGGAYNRRPAQATASVHRDQLFQLKHAAVVAPDAPPAAQAAAHYGPNYPRLVQLKACYDPANRFRSHQSLPPRPERAAGQVAAAGGPGGALAWSPR